MKHFKSLVSLAFCALLLLLLPFRAYGADCGELSAEVPFSFRNNSAVPHTCTAVMEPVEGAPAPEQSQAGAESGGQGQFVLRFSGPGTFQYRIYQTKKDLSGVIYDSRVYTLTVAVRNAGSGSLSSTMWATLNGEEKVDAIAFVNRDRPSETAPETRPTTSGAQPKTGDEGRPGLWAAVMASSALLLIIMILLRKRGKKEGDGI